MARVLAVRSVILPALLSLCLGGGRLPAQESTLQGAAFEAGAAKEDITPLPGLPMWGYGARKDIPCQGVLDSLWANALVLRVGDQKLAVVGLDLGRSPARATLKVIRDEVRERAGVGHVLLIGSHTHHGPCLELEKAPPTADYVRVLREKLVKVILQAAANLRPAKLGAASDELALNRNRHTKLQPKPVDRHLEVLRLDDGQGKVIATLVNFAAHPTTREATLLKWSSDFPGPMRARVEEELGGVCVYLQGACGDLSADRQGLDTDQFGRKLGGEVVRLARGIQTAVPAAPTLKVREEEFRFKSRVDHADPLVYAKFCLAFFKDLVDAYMEEYQDGIRPSLTVALLNDETALVSASGEFFANHALRLRERARLPHFFFLGYGNGYHQYFPTIEAVAEGGYGADSEVSPVEIGAGERMMDRALFHLFDMRKPMR